MAAGVACPPHGVARRPGRRVMDSIAMIERCATYQRRATDGLGSNQPRPPARCAECFEPLHRSDPLTVEGAQLFHSACHDRLRARARTQLAQAARLSLSQRDDPADFGPRPLRITYRFGAQPET